MDGNMWGKIKQELWDPLPQAEVALGVGVIGLVFLLIVPLSPWCLDLLLALNIALSIMTLLLTLYVERALEFSSFPVTLLLLTLYRLGLSIASTRMILTEGRAGAIIETFGNFVIRHHVGVGFLLFSLVTLINFVVITKGASRVAEVAARFSLEALPGKQMAVDAELHAGLIHSEEAKELHARMEQESEFYGAMDGASKFVRGDAIAGIIMILINLVGGMVLGTCVHQYRIQDCWELFSRLTVGDGLVTQLPALLISVSTGIMVTRSSSQKVATSMGTQFFCRPSVLVITAFCLILLACLPGMPALILGGLALGLLWYARSSRKRDQVDRLLIHAPETEMLVGARLAKELPRLAHLWLEEQSRLTESLGVQLPPIHLRYEASLPEFGCALRTQGEVGCHHMVDIQDPLKRLRNILEREMYHCIRRQDACLLFDRVARHDPALFHELRNHAFTPTKLLPILRQLLKESVAPPTGFSIFETIIETHLQTKAPTQELLLQRIREQLAPQITRQFLGETKRGYSLRIDPKVERMIALSSFQEEQGSKDRLRPATIEKIQLQIEQLLHARPEPLVLVVHDGMVRTRLHGLLHNMFPNLPVLALQELTPDVHLETIGWITKEVLV